MRVLIVLLLLSFSIFSYGVCPDDTDLNDKSARDKCFYNVMTHWQRVAEKLIIKEWQDGMAGRKIVSGRQNPLKGGLDESTHWILYNRNRQLFRDLLVLQRMIDRFEKEGVYQKPYKETPSEN